MRHVRALIGRLSYANVIATIALFVALGGASYAAIVLPAHSVGRRQLRTGAVTPAVLSFPLGVTGATNKKVERVYKSFCNAPNPPGIHIMGVCALLRRNQVRTPGSEVTVRLRTPGRLLVSALAGLSVKGPADARVTERLEAFLDGNAAGGSDGSLTATQTIQQPLQLMLPVGAGTHRVGVRVEEVRYSSYQSAELLIAPVSLVVSVLPAAH